MKDFTASAGRLRTLSVGAKLVYTSFALSALLGMLVSWRLYGSVVGDEGARAYYAGAPIVATSQSSSGSGGPVVELDDEAKAPRVIIEQVSDRKLLEVTHFHLFSVPVYVLVLAHLWLLAKLPPWLHSAGVVASVLASALHVAAPWLTRGRPALAAMMPISGALMLVTLGVVALVPAVDMWLPRPRQAGRSVPPGPA